MEFTKFKVLWLIAAICRERGEREPAKKFFELAMQQRMGMLLPLPHWGTSSYWPFEFSEEPPQPKTLEEYREAALWYKRRRERLEWNLKKIRRWRESQHLTLP